MKLCINMYRLGGGGVCKWFCKTAPNVFMCHCWPCLFSTETWQRRRLQFFVSMCMRASVCVFSCKLSMHFLRWMPEACVGDWKHACYLGLALQSFVFNSFKHCTLWSAVNIYSVKRTSLDAGKVLRPVTKKKRKNALENDLCRYFFRKSKGRGPRNCYNGQLMGGTAKLY